MWALMSSNDRRRLLLLLPIVVVNALVQVVGIASVIPFLSLVSNPEAISTNRFLATSYDLLGFQSDRAFLVAVGVGVLVVLVLSNALTALSELLMLRYSWFLNHSISVRMLREYLYKPYAFFLDQNTAGLAKNLLAEAKLAVSGFLISGIHLVARGVVAVFILALLVAVNPSLALLTFGFLGGAYGAVFWFVRRRMTRAGQQRSLNERARYKAATEALLGVKDIKLMGREPVFIDRFRAPSKRFAHYMAQQQVISMLPRYAFETIAFGGMLIIVLFMLARGDELVGVLPTLGVYAFASYRLLPALQSLFSATTQMRFSVPAVNVLYDDLDRTPPPRPIPREDVEPLPFRDRLELKHLTFTYPGAHSPVLQDFDLTIRANTTVALVGGTGSGKTTTVDILLGLLAPEEGRLVVDGKEVTGENLAAWQKNLGYVPQQIYLADDTVAANIAFGVPAEEIDMEAVVRSAKLANVHDFIMSELDHGYDNRIGERGIRLSGGQRQRLGIARALYQDPDVLLLDEATSALDGVTEEAIFQAVREIGRSKTVIMIAHRLTTVRDSDVIFVLERGKLVGQGTYDELMATSPAFRAMARAGQHDDVAEPAP